MKARISVDIEVIIHDGEPDEGGYWAEVPSLPGCYSQGETIQEMLANIKEAIEGHLEAISEANVQLAGQAVVETAPTVPAPRRKSLKARSK